MELKKKERELTNLESTIGFNYIMTDYQNQSFHIWELGGDYVSRTQWPTLYRTVSVNMVIYVINVYDEVSHQIGIKEFLKLINEEELKVARFILLFNIKIDDNNKRIMFNDQDMNDIKLIVDSFMVQLQDSPIHDYDNRVSYFIFDISKLKEGEFNSMRLLNKCFMIKEKEIS